MERLRATWDDIRSSLWFRPGILVSGALVAAWIALGLDRRLVGTPVGEALRAWAGDAESSRQVLATIAGGMITIAGVSFSIVVIALVLASNQFAPRVLRNFTADRVNQTVLGVFVGTFVYSVLVLRSIRGAAGETGPYVPAIAVSLAVGLSIVSLGFFIYFIHHIAQNIQVSRIVRNVAELTEDAIEELFERERAPTGPARTRAAVFPPAGPHRVAADDEGYVVRIDEEGLVDAAADEETVIESVVGPGDFVALGSPLVVAHRTPEDPDGFDDRVRGSFVLGRQRTIASDPSFGFRELVDVAVKALSPGVNDPNTACNCVDYLGSFLRRMADRDWPSADYEDDDGVVRLRVPAADFSDYLDLAFAEIRRYGVSDLAVSLRLIEALGGVGLATERADRRDQIWEATTRVMEAADHGLVHPADRDRLNGQLVRFGNALDRDPDGVRLSVRHTIEERSGPG